MIINKKTIFYFSGTGNSLQVSKDIALQLQNTEILSIPKIINNNEIEIVSECIGIVFPVYMFGLPLIVDDFIKKLKINKSTYVFAVSTCAGTSGNSLKQINDLMKIKDTKLNAGFVLKMPGNNIVMYGANSEQNQINAFKKEKIKVQQIIDIVKEKKDYQYEKSNIVMSNVIAPLIYPKIKEIRTKDRYFWTKENCTGCGVCQKICSVKNIDIANSKPRWKNNCEQCMACIQYCPNEAIEYGKRTIGRKRYRNPYISLRELINSD